ncbi:MAG: S16 family serine protease, partial [Clostridia bacterium]
LVDVDGTAGGQVNALSVISLGHYAFGHPSRITANTYMGNSGVVNIERQVKISGTSHSKGVLILSGYLSEKFAQDKPLALSASLTFEQMYGGVDGDSASSTELYALLSSLSGLPIKQSIAVTGSVNQKGKVQPIGGVNEKIEGFYYTCKTKGLTGEQGVMIPEQNVDNLMLKEEVREAVERGDFHIWAVSDVRGGIELLTGVPAGELDEEGRYPEDTVFGKADARLRKMAEIQRRFGDSSEDSEEEE